MTQQELVKYFNRIAALRVVINKPENLKANNARVLYEYRQSFIPEIFETAGENIGLPFKDKKSRDWAKYRAYPSAPKKWMKGVFTGETYEGLYNGIAAGQDVRIVNTINSRQIRFGYQADTPRNVNIGMNDEFVSEQTKKSAEFFGNLAITFLKGAGRSV